VTCDHCGAEQLEAARRCPECGVALKEEEQEASGQELPADIPALLADVYELEALIGEGSMGRVLRGRHKLTDQIVAVKALPGWCAQRADVRARFLDEGKVLSKLGHPNVVKMLTFLEQDKRLYLVMEYVPGRNLDDLLAAGPLGSDSAVQIAGQVLAALAHLHSRGMIHRDIKPGNIRIRPDGAVKLMDLGLAKMRHGAANRHTAFMVGTLAYMPPEQAKGKGVDYRSDLYAFGVTLFEMVAGRVPFEYDQDHQMRRAHAAETPPDLAELAPQANLALTEAVAQAMEKDPTQRFQSANEFREALGLPPYRIESVDGDALAADASPGRAARPLVLGGRKARRPAAAEAGGATRTLGIGLVVAGVTLAVAAGALFILLGS